MSQLSLIPPSDRMIRDAFDDFILSCEAKLLSPRTITWYERNAGGFVGWLMERGVPDPGHPRHARTRLPNGPEGTWGGRCERSRICAWG
jgi:hypothetical protein